MSEIRVLSVLNVTLHSILLISKIPTKSFDPQVHPGPGTPSHVMAPSRGQLLSQVRQGGQLELPLITPLLLYSPMG